MSRDTAILLLFGALFVTPFALAVGAAVLSRLLRTWSPSGAQGRRAARRPSPSRDDWPVISEFARRRDHFTKVVAGAVLAGVFCAIAGLPLTAIGLFVLMPIYVALRHLRCPRCDTSTTLKGVTDGTCCLRCGQRLRY